MSFYGKMAGAAMAVLIAGGCAAYAAGQGASVLNSARESAADLQCYVLTVRDGVLVVLGKARGSRNGNNLLNETIRKIGGINFDMPYRLAYSGTDDALLRGYIENSRAIWEDKTSALPVSGIGCVIGTPTGPGLIGVAFFAAGQVYSSA